MVHLHIYWSTLQAHSWAIDAMAPTVAPYISLSLCMVCEAGCVVDAHLLHHLLHDHLHHYPNCHLHHALRKKKDGV